MQLSREKRTVSFYDEVMNQYIEYKNKVNPKTYNNYLRTHNKRVKEFIGHLPIDKITQEHIKNVIFRHRTNQTDPLSLKSLILFLML